jgi:predicted alpha/beta-hydrolase family hydrolase
MLCFWPVETGAWVVTCATGVETGVRAVATTVGDAVAAVVATVVFVSFPVHPAANASMRTATMLSVNSKYELLFSFMVFYHPFYSMY